jgi:hypothetical protein
VPRWCGTAAVRRRRRCWCGVDRMQLIWDANKRNGYAITDSQYDPLCLYGSLVTLSYLPGGLVHRTAFFGPFPLSSAAAAAAACR